MSNESLSSLAREFGGTITVGTKAQVIEVPSERIVGACVAVSKLPGFYHLSTITGVDEGESIALHYHFWQGRSFVDVKTEVPKGSAMLPSITSSMPAATLYEAEVQDLFGVTFTGNPYLGRRLLLPDDYPADAPPPLRKEADPEKIRKMMKLE